MESRLRYLLAAEGVKEFPVRYQNKVIGRADACTDTHVIEIKDVSNFKHAIGQCLVYSFCTGKKARLILIGDASELIRDVCKKYGIDVQFVPPDDIAEASDDWRFLLTCDQLKALCSKKDLKQGNKGEMVMRLSSLSAGTPICTLDDLTCEQLKTILKGKNVQCSKMKKDELLTCARSLFPN